MKHIKKSISNEPETLRDYRNNTPGATYNGFTDTNQLLKKALLKEQGHICAYCMKRITLELNDYNKPKIEVEHYLSQKLFPNMQLKFKNMLGVCNGKSGIIEHCDKSKKEKSLLKLNPFKSNCENLLTYSLSGRIESISNNSSINNDLELLNLNNQNLIDIRKMVMDESLKKLKERLKQLHPGTSWTKKMFQGEIDEWNSKDSNGRYKSYCMVGIWILEKEKNKGKYI